MTFPLLSWHIPFNSSQKSKQGTHKKEASGPSGISSQETHIKKKQKERKKERYHDSLARSAAYQVLAPRNKSKNWNLPNEAQLRMLANDMRNRDPTMPDETKNDGTT